MKDHQYYTDRLPLYAAGQLDERECAELDNHLENCPACRSDLNLWLEIGNEIAATNRKVQAPEGVARLALESLQTSSSLRGAIRRTFSLLFSQAYLLRREMWPSTAILMLIGVAATFLSEKAFLVRYFAPLVAAASLTTIFGPDHDPVCELTLATPTSPWKLLLARLAWAHGYNLTLTLIASLFLLLIVPSDMLGMLILGWLGPMTFLPALALLLSLWVGSSNSVAITYGLWLLQFVTPNWIPGYLVNLLGPVAEVYRQFWASPFLLMTVGLVLVVTALWSSGRMGTRLIHNPV